MKAYGIHLEPSTRITNTNVDFGTSFPVDDLTGSQIFYRTDLGQLFQRNTANTGWKQLSSPEFLEVSQTGHGFTTDDIGAPVYYDGSEWNKARADVATTIATAAISDIVDVDNFMVQTGGVITGIHASVNEDIGFLVPGRVYFVSRTTAGKYTAVYPDKTEVNQGGIMALTEDSAFLLFQQMIPPIPLHQLSNVDSLTATNNQVLMYNLGSDKWIPGTADSGASTLGELNDVSISVSPGPSDNDVLTYNDSTGLWEAAPAGVGSGNTSVVTDNADGTYTHDDGTGTTVVLDTRAASNPFDSSAGGYSPGLSATTVQGAIDEIAQLDRNTSVVTDNTDGTYTHEDGAGNSIIIDTNTPAEDSTFDPNAGGYSPALSATNVQDAIDELAQMPSGGSVAFASNVEVVAQTVTDKAIAPDTAANYLLRTNAGSPNIQVVENEVNFQQDVECGVSPDTPIVMLFRGSEPQGRGLITGTDAYYMMIDKAVIDGGTWSGGGGGA